MALFGQFLNGLTGLYVVRLPEVLTQLRGFGHVLSYCPNTVVFGIGGTRELLTDKPGAG